MMTDKYVSMNEAQVILKVSRTKMWKLVKEGILKTYSDPLDKRKRLVRKEDLEKLQRFR